MIIRLANEKDKEEILRLFDELRNITEEKPVVISQEYRRRCEKFYDEVIQRKDTHIFVAEEKGKLLGMITFYLLPNIKHGWLRGHIEDMMVTRSVRGKGIGSQLLSYVKQYCKDNNIKVIKLDSDHKLTSAHEFYKKNGGRQTELMFRFDI